jgi:hypothetical protein
VTYFDPPEQERHACQPPSPNWAGKEGWRCECGKAYVREQVSQHGETWWQWRRHPDLDAADSGSSSHE